MFQISQDKSVDIPLSVMAKRHAKPMAAALLLTGFALFGFIKQANAATVDCSRASTPAEFAICNSETLQQLDDNLSQRFATLIQKATTVPVRQVVKKDLDRFLINRNRCGADTICLQLKYENELHKSRTTV